MLKNIVKILAIFIIGIAGGIFADQILWPYFVERPLFYQYRLERPPVNIIEKKEIFIEENVALKEAIEKVEKVVLGVKSQTKKGKILAEGSGLILTADGQIVTLADLIPSGADFNFFWQGESLSYQVLKRDLNSNLALVKLEKNNLPPAAFSDPEKIRLGERVFLIGIVFENGKTKKIVNEGIIQSFDDFLIETNIFERENLQGSPLFNIKGEVVGLVKVDKKGKVSAIPVKKIREFSGL